MIIDMTEFEDASQEKNKLEAYRGIAKKITIPNLKSNYPTKTKLSQVAAIYNSYKVE